MIEWTTKTVTALLALTVLGKFLKIVARRKFRPLFFSNFIMPDYQRSRRFLGNRIDDR